MKKQLLFLFLFIFAIKLTAQQQKFGFELMHHLKQVEKDEMVPLLVESYTDNLPELIDLYSAHIRLKVNRLYSIEIPAKHVRDFASNPMVKQIDFSLAPPHYLSDTMLINTRAKSVHQMLGSLRTKYSGKGVLMGFIESGIELQHPDFKDLDSNNRILYIWDQAASYQANRQANQYTYGVEWNTASINNGISTHDDNPQEYGHGTNVTAVAASSGLATGNYIGVAPEVNIVSVATDFYKTNWLQTVAEAVDYIFSKADSLGIPVVINASVGTYLGSHDGADIAARMIDQMIRQKNGRAMVAAAGNAAQIPFHLQHNLQNDTLFSWFKQHNLLWNNQSGIFFELWSDTADFNNISFSFAADQYQNGRYGLRGRTAFAKGKDRLNQIYTDSIMSPQNKRLAIVQTYVDSAEGRYRMQVQISQIDSTQYHYRFESSGTGTIDIWSSYSLFGHSDIINSPLPTLAQYPEMRKYQKSDSLQTMVSSFTTLPSVLTVGNYVNRSQYVDVKNRQQQTGRIAGSISENSSLGPNRRGLLKPEISSSGDYIFAAGRLATMQAAIQNNPAKVSPDSLHYRNGGTSMAAPTVAGMIALLLEQCPSLNHATITNAVVSSARSDQFTQNLPNPKWGNGKADAFALLQNEVFSPKLNVLQSPPYCEGEGVQLSSMQTYAAYRWSNGDTTASTTISQSDTLMAWVAKSNSCWSPSDTLILNFKNKPPKPLIEQRNDSLLIIGNFQGSFQWFLNGQPIAQANQQLYIATASGLYYCQYSDTNNCSIFSDSIQHQLVGITKMNKNNQQWKVYPNPIVNGKLHLENHQQKEYVLSIYTISGQKVYENKSRELKETFNLHQLSKGLYLIKVNDEDGGQFTQKLQLQ